MLVDESILRQNYKNIWSKRKKCDDFAFVMKM